MRTWCDIGRVYKREESNADQQGDLLVDSEQPQHGRDGNQGVDDDVKPAKHLDLVVEVLHRVLPHDEAEDAHPIPEKEDEEEEKRMKNSYIPSTPSTSSALSTAHCGLLLMM